MTKKIVIKMRSYKKLINQDLLTLALLISVLKVDPDSLGLRQRYGYDTGGGVMLGEAWTPHTTLPFMPLKGSTELIERYQEEIIEDLNTLGQFNRFSLYGNIPVQLSAYLVEADQCLGQEDGDLDNHTDTDSGISDIENLGSPFSQNSGDHPHSPRHLPSPCPQSPHHSTSEETVTKDGEGIATNTVLSQEESDLMDFEDVVRDLVASQQEVEAAVGGSGGLHDFQDFYDMELMTAAAQTEFIGTANSPPPPPILSAATSEFGEQLPEYGPHIPEELAAAGIPDIDDHGAIQYELMHMDEQLMNLDYNIEDLDEAFLKMDEEIAKTISEDDMLEEEVGAVTEEVVDQDMTEFNLFQGEEADISSWQSENAFQNIPELLELNAVLPPETNILTPELSAVPDSSPLDVTTSILQEPDPNFDLNTLDRLESMDESLQDFNLDMLDSTGVLQSLDESENVLRNDVLLSHSRPASRQHMSSNLPPSIHRQVFIPDTFVNPTSLQDEVKEEGEEEVEIKEEDNMMDVKKEMEEEVEETTSENISVEEALLRLDNAAKQEEVKEELPEIIEIKQEPVEEEEDDVVVVKEIVREVKKDKKRRRDEKKKRSDDQVVGKEGVDQEDLIAKVMKESGLDNLKMDSLEEIPEPEKVKSEIKDEGVGDEVLDEEEVLHEELLDVVDAAEFEETLHHGAHQVELSSMYTVERKGLTSFSLSYQPYFNWHGYRNDHAYTGEVLKGEETQERGGKISWRGEESGDGSTSRRRRDLSESSGYSSEDSRSTRDERLAEKMGLPYTVHELINCPVERFNKILADKDLTSDQAKLCKDIRRRGKNKVAAQNCRKRKLETIEELQVQVENVRRRKEQLLRQRQQLEEERRRWSSKLERIEQFVMAGLGKNMVEYTLQVVDDRVEVTTRVGSSGPTSSSSRARSRQ